MSGWEYGVAQCLVARKSQWFQSCGGGMSRCILVWGVLCRSGSKSAVDMSGELVSYMSSPLLPLLHRN